MADATEAKKHLKSISTNTILVALLLAIFWASLFMGRYSIDPRTVILILTAQVVAPFHPIQQTWPQVMDTVVLEVRFPRSLAAILVGAGLAVCGAAFQGTFRNPLVSESILGVSAGALVGASIGILLDQGPYTIQLLAFGFGILAVAMTFSISRVYKANPTLVLVLAGIVVASLFSAVSALIKYVRRSLHQAPRHRFLANGVFQQSLND